MHVFLESFLFRGAACENDAGQILVKLCYVSYFVGPFTRMMLAKSLSKSMLSFLFRGAAYENDAGQIFKQNYVKFLISWGCLRERCWPNL
jgi:hypothetical protein